MTQKIDLDALEAALAKGTPGEWITRDHSKDEQCIYIEAPGDGVATVFTDCKASLDENRATASFIALAHNALPALIAELRQLRAYQDEVEANIPTVQALLDSGERARAEAADLRARTTPEVIGEKHRDGQRWQLFFPSVYGWDVGYWQNGSWWVDGRRTIYTPTHALPMPGVPEGKP